MESYVAGSKKDKKDKDARSVIQSVGLIKPFYVGAWLRRTLTSVLDLHDQVLMGSKNIRE